MHKTRLEAFSDAVIAIIMTIMVLELKVPHGADLHALLPLAPVFLAYVMSYLYLGIYWNNHHHMLHAADHVDGRVLWANMLLLFWLSLIPFTTAWMEENAFAELPTAIYGFVLLLAAMSYSRLQKAIIRHHGKDGKLKQAVGADIKGKTSLALYILGILLSFWSGPAAVGVYILVALMWLVPDKRIERVMRHEHA